MSDAPRALAARVEGEGPALLLLHGQPGTGADWHGVVAALRDRFMTIVPDRPGYGRTGGRAVGFEANARAALALLDRLSVERAAVAGHSWGAGVALALAALAPDRVEALALVSPVSPFERFGRVDRALADRRLGPRLAYGGLRIAGRAFELEPVRRLMAAALPGHGADRAAEIAREWRHGRTWRSFYAEQRALFEELPRLRGELDAIAAPATVVIGDHDRVTSPDDGRVLARELGARVVEFRGAGHLLPLREPARVAEAIATAA